MTASRKRVSFGLGLVGVALAVLVGRLWIDGQVAVTAGMRAEEAGRTGEAIARYLEAARLYTPGFGPAHVAVRRLVALGVAAERASDVETARRSFEAVRAAALGTRWLVQPWAESLEQANRSLARIYAAEAGKPRRGDPGQREAEMARLLARAPGPGNGPVALALLGCALWLGAVVGFVRAGLSANLTLRPGPAAAAGIAFVVGVALFVVGLRLA